MQRCRRCLMPAFVVLGAFVAVQAGQPNGSAKPSGDRAESEKWLVDRSLTITAAAAPVPAFQYRLLPLGPERKEGNAVPIYLRLMFERNEAWKRMMVEKPEQWNALPVEKLPLDEVRKFFESFRGFLQQMDLGARRKHADWNYTLDQRDIFGILLPDAQTMRRYGPLLVLKARFEIAEGHFENAAHTLETGFAFSQHVGDGPFLISQLIAFALEDQFNAAVLDFIAAPHSPNLYWALTALPRPLVSTRKGMELEQTVLTKYLPELADLDRPRTASQWASVLKEMRTAMERLVVGTKDFPAPIAGTQPDDQADRSPDLETAKKFLIDEMKMPAAEVERMPAPQIIVTWLAKAYATLVDDNFKSGYLPWPESQAVQAQTFRAFRDAPETEAKRLAHILMPAVQKVQLAEIRTQRKAAAARAIEAIRIYAAAHDGQLPEQLSAVKEVPVPLDPGTNRPFDYRKDGATAVLTSRLPDWPTNTTGLRYRLTVAR